MWIKFLELTFQVAFYIKQTMKNLCYVEDLIIEN